MSEVILNGDFSSGFDEWVNGPGDKQPFEIDAEMAKASSWEEVMIEGAIVAWIGGYFTNGANAGYTRVLGSANTIAAVNTLLNAKGFYACNGAALNLGTSTIFNGAGRYLPNLTDDRFIMGDNAAGGIGGSSTMAHTHGIGSYAAANEGSHIHAKGSIATGNESAHVHAKGTIVAASESAHTHAKGTIVAASESAHTHAKGSIATGNESAHTHGAGSFAVGSHQHVAPVTMVASQDKIYCTENWGVSFSEQTSTHTRFVCVSSEDREVSTDSWLKTKATTPGFSGTSGSGSAHSHSVSGSTAAGSSHTHTLSGSTAAGSSHTHTLSGSTAAGSAHNHSVSGTTAAGSAHTHSLSGTSAAASNTENRPRFLSVFYLIYVFA